MGRRTIILLAREVPTVVEELGEETHDEPFHGSACISCFVTEKILNKVLNLIDYFISPFGGLAGAGNNLLDEFGLLRTHPSLYVDKAWFCNCSRCLFCLSAAVIR